MNITVSQVESSIEYVDLMWNESDQSQFTIRRIHDEHMLVASEAYRDCELHEVKKIKLEQIKIQLNKLKEYISIMNGG